ncbi:MAG: hypothetical protein ACLFU9_01785 [Candidatus Bathyarchaeia archaeon]
MIRYVTVDWYGYRLEKMEGGIEYCELQLLGKIGKVIQIVNSVDHEPRYEDVM